MGHKEKQALALLWWQIRFATAVAISAAVRPRAFFSKPWAIDVRIKGLGLLHVRRRDSDSDTLRQVFGQGDYDVSRFPQYERILARYRQILEAGRTPLVIDAGANIGAASIWFAKLFPEASIVAIEPDPDNAEICRRNTRAFKSIQVLECALGSRGGEVYLQKEHLDSWSTRTERSEEAGSGVRICTIADAEKAADGDLFLVKIDIEGFEDDLFASNTEWIERAQAIIIETHDWMLPGRYSSRTMQQALFPEGFELLLHGENLIFVR